MTPEEDARLRAALSDCAGRVEAALDTLLPPVDDSPEGVLAAAMRHGALAGGKRLRAFLALETARLFGGDRAGALRAAAAVECLHAYSLIHDDLPAMDDDDMRRGQPTVHVKWDEATAILAGDALQTLAFEILSDPATHADPAVRADLCLSLARAAGAGGMVGGQMIDIAAETAALDLPRTERLQALKTGALIVFASEAGAILSGAAAEDRRRLRAFAADLGLGFQIQDDIIDVTGDAAAAGKAVGKDAAAGKATFVDLLGLSGARAKADELAMRACEAMSCYGPRAEALCLAAKFSVSRRA